MRSEPSPFPPRQLATRLLAAVLIVAATLVATVSATARSSEASDGELHEVAEMPALVGCNTTVGFAAVKADGPCPIVVDPFRNLAWSVGKRRPGESALYTRVYDPDRLTVVSEVKLPETPSQLTPLDIIGSAVDPGRPRTYVASFQDEPVIDLGPRGPEDCGLGYLDYSEPTQPGWVAEGEPLARYSCSKYLNVLTLAAPQPGVVLLGGMYEEDRMRDTDVGEFLDPYEFFEENLGQPLIVRLLRQKEGGLAQEWDLDLRYAGCGRRAQQSQYFDKPYSSFLTRIGSDLIAYCWDPKVTYTNGGLVGEQGYVVRIPLGDDGHPEPIAGSLVTDANGAYANYRFVRTPTLPGYLHVLPDPQSGLLLLVSQGGANGNAVWLFDAAADRFVGVVTGGFAAERRNNTAVGIDRVRGRLYVLTQDGVLMVPFRRRPLSGGLLYPVAVNRPIPHDVSTFPGSQAPFPRPAGDAGDATDNVASNVPCFTKAEPFCRTHSELRRRDDWANVVLMPVAPKGRRLFLALNRQAEDGQAARYVVVQDDVAEPPTLDPADPDANTTQVPEVNGKTEVSARGQARASGAHMLVVGGVTRTINQVDPGCHATFPQTPTVVPSFEVALEPSVFVNGRCLADQILTSGKREWFLGTTEAEVGTNSGATARGSALGFGPDDVTAEDVRNAGSCGRASAAALLRGNDPGVDPETGEENGFAQFCNEVQDRLTAQATDENGNRQDDPNADPNDPRRQVPDLREGTRGRGTRGFPLPASICGDFGSDAMSDSQGGTEAGPTGALHSSSAACDAARTAVRAAAETSGFAIAHEGSPVLSVARTSSSVVSVRDPKLGQVTVAVASAQGVRVGPLAIREVRSFALTRTKGRTGQAETRFVRQWCGLTDVGTENEERRTGLGLPEHLAAGCIDPGSEANQDFVALVNQFLTKARLGVPAVSRQATPGGFQAVVTKDPDVRAGDQAVNHDDSHTVSALEMVVYNDGKQGLNRVVVQLAGVHAESRYGIVRLPDFDFDAGPVEPPASTGDPAPAPEPPGPEPGVVEAPGPGVFSTPESFLVEEPALSETERFFAAPPPRQTVPQLTAPSRVPRIVRVPFEVLKGAIELLVQHPREFALLFVMWSLLAAPGYLLARRRSFARALAASG